VVELLHAKEKTMGKKAKEKADSQAKVAVAAVAVQPLGPIRARRQ
jgi:hypothetical protein